MRQCWLDLLFMHWPVRVEALRPLIPLGLEIEVYDGQAWVGVVPFRMEDVSPRFVPPLPYFSAFEELNVRTYVRAEDKPGVWFFSLDAANLAAVYAARTAFHLPYFHSKMQCAETNQGVSYT